MISKSIRMDVLLIDIDYWHPPGAELGTDRTLRANPRPWTDTVPTANEPNYARFASGSRPGGRNRLDIGKAR